MKKAKPSVAAQSKKLQSLSSTPTSCFLGTALSWDVCYIFFSLNIMSWRPSSGLPFHSEWKSNLSNGVQMHLSRGFLLLP